MLFFLAQSTLTALICYQYNKTGQSWVKGTIPLILYMLFMIFFTMLLIYLNIERNNAVFYTVPLDLIFTAFLSGFYIRIKQTPH